MRRLLRALLVCLTAVSLIAFMPVRIVHAQDQNCSDCGPGGGPQFDPSMSKVTNADGTGTGAYCEPFTTNAGYYCTCEEVAQFYGAWTTGYFIYYGWVYWYYYVPYYYNGDLAVNVCVY